MAKRCPRCKAEIPEGSAPSPHAPFCSERCRLLDLGAWLEGEYRIPGKPVAPAPRPGEGEGDGDGDGEG